MCARVCVKTCWKSNYADTFSHPFLRSHTLAVSPAPLFPVLLPPRSRDQLPATVIRWKNRRSNEAGGRYRSQDAEGEPLCFPCPLENPRVSN